MHAAQRSLKHKWSGGCSNTVGGIPAPLATIKSGVRERARERMGCSKATHPCIVCVRACVRECVRAGLPSVSILMCWFTLNTDDVTLHIQRPFPTICTSANDLTAILAAAAEQSAASAVPMQFLFPGARCKTGFCTAGGACAAQAGDEVCLNSKKK